MDLAGEEPSADIVEVSVVSVLRRAVRTRPLLRRREGDRAFGSGSFRPRPRSGTASAYRSWVLSPLHQHPNNLIDSLLVGRCSRKCTTSPPAALSATRSSARFLLALGVIPVYRKADDPDKMDRNMRRSRRVTRRFDHGRVTPSIRRRHPRGAARAADQDGRGADRARYEAHAPGASRSCRWAQFRGPQEGSAGASSCRSASRRRLVVPRRLSRGTGKALHSAHDGDSVGNGARGRPRRAHRHRGARRP